MEVFDAALNNIMPVLELKVRRIGGALISAGTAVDADVSVDLELAVALSDSLDGALVGAGAAGDASIGNSVSHDISSHKYCCQPQFEVACLYSSTVF